MHVPGVSPPYQGGVDAEIMEIPGFQNRSRFLAINAKTKWAINHVCPNVLLPAALGFQSTLIEVRTKI